MFLGVSDQTVRRRASTPKLKRKAIEAVFNTEVIDELYENS